MRATLGGAYQMNGDRVPHRNNLNQRTRIDFAKVIAKVLNNLILHICLGRRLCDFALDLCRFLGAFVHVPGTKFVSSWGDRL